MNYFAKLLGRKFCVLFIVQQSGNLKKSLKVFFFLFFFLVVVFVYDYGLGEQIKFISIPNLEVFIVNELGGGR